MKKNKKMNGGAFKRVIKMLFKFYPVLLPLTIFCILFSAAAAAVPDMFIQKVITIIGKFSETRDWAAASGELMPKIYLLVGIYIVSLIAIVVYTQLMAFITQGFCARCAVLCLTGCRTFLLNTLIKTNTAI